MADSVVDNASKARFEKFIWISVVFCTVSVPFVMTLIALVHIDDCPHQEFIPIVLLMAGISMSLSNIINSADKYSPPKQTNYRKRKFIVSSLNLFTNCLTLASLFAGGIWIYGKGKPSYTKSNPDYCNPTLYIFTLWLLNLSIGFILLIAVILIIGFLIKYIKA